MPATTRKPTSTTTPPRHRRPRISDPRPGEVRSVRRWAHLGAQLPLLIRGIYYEGWDPGKTPERLRDAGAFLDRVSRDIVFDEPRAVRASVEVLRRHVSAGEMDQVLQMLPADVRQLMAA